jgi:hypothetical protein
MFMMAVNPNVQAQAIPAPVHDTWAEKGFWHQSVTLVDGPLSRYPPGALFHFSAASYRFSPGRVVGLSRRLRQGPLRSTLPAEQTDRGNGP